MDLVVVAVVASTVALSIPYLRAHDVIGALRAELRMVADVQQLVADTRRADAATRANAMRGTGMPPEVG